ncbi:MAG: type II secretion system F domain, type IV pilus assembly protein PilC [Candidatus Magasanikbacteria bacterium]|nr:type II secretion system F domain, type IV pilus assembly protein PilC [Candidatus Magasanikbacteria bacterium]
MALKKHLTIKSSLAELPKSTTVVPGRKPSGGAFDQFRPPNKLKQALEWFLSHGTVSHLEKLLFTKNLSVMIRAGITLVDGLAILQDQAVGKFKKILTNILATVGSGQPLAMALAKYPRVFSPVFVQVIRTGEASGTLDSSLEQLAVQLTKEQELRQRVRSAMMYPTLVLVATVGLGFALAYFVLPQLSNLFLSLNIDLPLSTKILLFLARSFQRYGLWIIVGFVLIVMAFIWLLRQRFVKPITHRIILVTPLFKSLSLKINMARFCRTLGTLLQSGLPIDQALAITSEVLTNYVYRQAVKAAMPIINRGDPLSIGLTLHPRLIPKFVSRMVGVGEQTGSMEKTLLYLADFYENEVDTATKNLSTVVEPLLLIVIGFVVGFVAVAIITPIYKVTASIKR